VRGRERIIVVAILAGAAGAAGATAGFAFGVPAAAAGIDAAPTWVAGLFVVAAAAMDLAGRGPRPWSVERQVPREWTRLFSLRTAAALYGARLGVGPLTVLNTWVWWAAAAVGASLGPGWSALVGASFGVARVVVMVPVGLRAAPAMSVRMARVVQRERLVSPAATALLVVTCAALVLGGCSGGSRPRLDEPATPVSDTPIAGVPLDDELDAVLIDEPPVGFEPVNRPGVTGPLDLEAAAAAEPDVSAERALLETRGFRRGHARAWRHADGTSLFALVYEFEDPPGARAYRRDGLVTLEGFGARRFDVHGIAGARGFTQIEAEDGATSHAITFTRGSRFFLVFARSDRSDVTPDDARALAVAQSALA